MSDTVATVGASTVQHGPYNDRVYLMKLARADFPGIIGELDALASENGYSKIFVKVPAYARDAFVQRGYVVEACVPGLYRGAEDAYFLGRYLSGQRRRLENAAVLDEVLVVAKARADDGPEFALPPRYRFRILAQADAVATAELYRKIFATYPFPIFDPAYVEASMERDVVYFGIFRAGRLVAVSAAEMDVTAANVEMTDFAALPTHGGRGLGVYLLQAMEEAMRSRGMITAYTISRAASYEINITFARLNYAFAGTLVNNTNISGQLESMNVWYKKLSS